MKYAYLSMTTAQSKQLNPIWKYVLNPTPNIFIDISMANIQINIKFNISKILVIRSGYQKKPSIITI